MNEEINTEHTAYLSYEINGAQFILQPLVDTSESLVAVENDMQRDGGLINEVEFQKEEEPIPLVCLDGQIYAFQNGELQELDLSHLVDQNDQVNEIEQNDDIVITNDVEHRESDESECIAHFVSDGDPLRENIDDSDQKEYQVISKDDERNLIVGKHGLNANDFVEVVTAFKCKICPYTTQDRSQLLEHFENVHINPSPETEAQEQEESKNEEEVKLVYMCGECSNCFPSIEDCREHMINDHQLTDREADNGSRDVTKSDDGDSKLSVSNSGSGAETNGSKRQIKVPKALSSEYAQNKKIVDTKERNVKCTYRGCLYKFSSEETMQQHASCHVESQNVNVFRCNICRDMKFTKWRPCSLHLWKKHEIDIDLLTCKICKAYKSATMVKLLTHMRVHSESREFECTECGKCFKQPSQLRNHRVMHIDRKTAEPRWYTSKTCEICGKTYADSKCLKNHIQAVHSKLRPYVCNVCGHSSARKAMLQMHLRQHTGDKPFNCELCEYKTGDHNSLRRHIMRHTGVRPYKCPHCPYSAIQSNSYKNHLRSKHPSLSGLFTCDLCSFKTVKKEGYMQHIGDHEKGLIKAITQQKDDENVEVFPGNIAAAQLIYSCLGAFSKVGKTIEANLMSSSTSADGTSQTITIQIPSKHLKGSLPTIEDAANNSSIDQEDDETMHCFLKIPKEEEENIDTGGITIPAEPEEPESTLMDIET
ncbi:zinc finger protein 93 [Orussus abietinus]|uniref:zinc finger protein 93 n=1 Tax=Orussus abietinus TaxID=222816 RepID=UPI00062546ED|nr:zinc finger protein 93 [Orussus abietinus]